MANITKIDLSRQSKLKEFTQLEIADLIEDGETLLYKGDNGELRMATKTGSVIEDVNPGRNYIKDLQIPSLPLDPSSLNPDEGYALCAVRDGFDFKLVWALVDTKENYNTP
jgi:hypothetical protein